MDYSLVLVRAKQSCLPELMGGADSSLRGVVLESAFVSFALGILPMSFIEQRWDIRVILYFS